MLARLELVGPILLGSAVLEDVVVIVGFLAAAELVVPVAVLGVGLVVAGSVLVLRVAAGAAEALFVSFTCEDVIEEVRSWAEAFGPFVEAAVRAAVETRGVGLVGASPEEAGTGGVAAELDLANEGLVTLAVRAGGMGGFGADASDARLAAVAPGPTVDRAVRAAVGDFDASGRVETVGFLTAAVDLRRGFFSTEFFSFSDAGEQDALKPSIMHVNGGE